MKNGRFITLTSVLVLMFGFVACTEDENYATYNKAELNGEKTKATYSITYDDIQARVNELHEKYQSGSSKINREQPIEIFDEDFFLMFENLMRKDAGLEPLEKSSTSFHNK